MLALMNKIKVISLFISLIAICQMTPILSQTTTINNTSGGFVIIPADIYQKISSIVVSGYQVFFNFYLLEVDIFIKFISPIMSLLMLLSMFGIIGNKKYNQDSSSDEKVDLIRDKTYV
jgi:hypothetical protein